jgi:hypothetical protein
MTHPLCFVLMPFGRKADAAGRTVDFDRVYGDLIAPAIAGADLEPLRADEEMTGGIIHKPMFERLILCEYAVADLTTANANVFYELGLRHAVRRWSTVLVFAEGGSQLPFDVAPLRALPYRLPRPGGSSLRWRPGWRGRRQAPTARVPAGGCFPDISGSRQTFRDQVRSRSA